MDTEFRYRRQKCGGEMKSLRHMSERRSLSATSKVFGEIYRPMAEVVLIGKREIREVEEE